LEQWYVCILHVAPWVQLFTGADSGWLHNALWYPMLMPVSCHFWDCKARQDQPQCSNCDCMLAVVHVLLECNHYNVVRQRYFNISSLRELFDTVNAQNILGFIRDIGLYRLM